MSTGKIVLGMSGGVDSNYSVKKLKDMGYEVIGATLIMSDETDDGAAKAVAKELGIEHITIDCRAEFEKNVIDDFVCEYLRGRTPNPCVVCNRHVKFKKLCELAKSVGADKVSTGHYVDIGHENGRYFIRRGNDIRKDQSYVLWNLTQEELGMLYFPLAEEDKKDVMKSAEALGLMPEDYSESQEICFIPTNDHAAFIEARNGKSKVGNFIDENGKVVGKHRGIINYTIGQRKGLGLSLGHPVFVYDIDDEKNTVSVSTEDKLFSRNVTCSNLNFQKTAPGNIESGRFLVKIRYAAQPTMATVNVCDGVASIVFDEPVRAATPGQSVVFYDGADIAFGGFIDSGRN